MNPTGTIFYIGNDQGVQQSVTFEDPGRSLSHFADLWILDGADVLLGSEVYLTGNLSASSSSPTTTTIRNPPEFVGRDILAAELQVNGLNSDGVHVELNTMDPNSPVRFDNVTYQGFPTTDEHVQLSIFHPGDGGPFSLSGVDFAPLDVGNQVGRYLQIWDVDEAEPFLEISLDREPGDGTTYKLGASGTEYLSELQVEIVNWP